MMNFTDALSETFRGKKIRRKAWGNEHPGLTGPKSALTLEDALSRDWETVTRRLSDVRIGEKFTKAGFDYVMLGATHVRVVGIKFKYVYFGVPDNQLYVSDEDFEIEKIG